MKKSDFTKKKFDKKNLTENKTNRIIPNQKEQYETKSDLTKKKSVER